MKFIALMHFVLSYGMCIYTFYYFGMADDDYFLGSIFCYSSDGLEYYFMKDF